MDELINTGPSAQRYEHNGYLVAVDATQGERGQWLPQIGVTRNGETVPLDVPESIGPYWATREEAIRAGFERARYLLDLRDRTPLDRSNPARGAR